VHKDFEPNDSAHVRQIDDTSQVQTLDSKEDGQKGTNFSLFVHLLRSLKTTHFIAVESSTLTDRPRSLVWTVLFNFHGQPTLDLARVLDRPLS